PSNGKAVAEAVATYRTGVEERVRKAETDRAAAEAEAREQRKRRKGQLGLGTAVAVIIGLLAAGAWYTDKKVREDDFARKANGQEAERHLGVCEKALEDSDADAAARELSETESRVPIGGADHLADRIARCKVELEMLLILDAIDNDRWT